MAENSKFGGFDSAFDAFLPTESNGENLVDPEDIEKEMEKFDTKEETPEETEVEIPEKTPTPESKKPVEKEEKKEVPEVDNKAKDEPTEEIEEVEYEEADLVDTFADLFAEELDWKFEEGEKPKSVKELIEYMQNVIEENSVPVYASDDIKELDKFVKNGGDIADFYKKVYSTEVNIDSVDLTKESNQKAVIKENLRNRGYSDERIEKLITRYENAESLEDEANDSLQEIKEYRDKTKAQLLERQQKQADLEKQQEQEFISNVQKLINDTANIRGIELSKKEKQELIDYIFKPEKDGMTKYQRDYNKDLNNLVESAFFTMKGKDFVQQIQKKATADATKSLKLKLKTRGKSTKNTVSEQEGNNSKVTQLWEIASRELKSF